MKKNIVGAFRSCLVVVLFVVISSYGQEQNPPQQLAEDDVVRVSTTLVTVPVSVMDRQGRFIPDLTKEKFHIYEDGIEQKIAYFDNAEKPFAVALMLDAGDSTRFKLKDIQDAALEFIDQLRPDDRVIVAAFDKNIAVLAEFGIAQNTLTISQRPWVLIQDIKESPPLVGSPFRVSVVTYNYGNSPAVEARAIWFLRFQRRDEPSPPSVTSDAPKLRNSLPVYVAPKKDIAIPVEGEPMSSTEIEAISNERKSLYVWGRIEYKDIFGQWHHTVFCGHQDWGRTEFWPCGGVGDYID